jgi:S-DNA-T family DNA segregation ATPase FtsK/SpoIIIE
MTGREMPARWLVVVVDLPGADCSPILGDAGRLGVSVLEATGNENSVIANAQSAYVVDDIGNLLKAPDQRESY